MGAAEPGRGPEPGRAVRRSSARAPPAGTLTITLTLTLTLTVLPRRIAHLRRDVFRARGQRHDLGDNARAAPVSQRSAVLRAWHEEQRAEAEQLQHGGPRDRKSRLKASDDSSRPLQPCPPPRAVRTARGSQHARHCHRARQRALLVRVRVRVGARVRVRLRLRVTLRAPIAKGRTEVAAESDGGARASEQ
eukprot:scaffold10872_cov52-Phaeocystis_antarctica.AAC.3